MDAGLVTPDRPATGGPRLRRRLLFLFASPVVLVVFVFIAWGLPGPRRCLSIYCGAGPSGAVDVFGVAT